MESYLGSTGYDTLLGVGGFFGDKSMEGRLANSTSQRPFGAMHCAKEGESERRERETKLVVDF